MADILKEIYNANIAVSDLYSTGAVTLATTNTTTQYVIKDILVSNSLVGTPVLDINNTEVVGLTASVTGSAIVDVSSTIKYKVSTTGGDSIVRNKYLLFSSTPSLQVEYDKSTFNFSSGGVSAVIKSEIINSSVTFTGATVNSYLGTHGIGKATDGSIFYIVIEPSTKSIYKRAGSINGALSTIVTTPIGSSAWVVFNGVDTYYYAYASNQQVLYKYNINTNATTTFTFPIILVGSSPHAWCLNNGLILLAPEGGVSSGTFYIINPVANTSIYISISALILSSYSGRVLGYYNATTDRYTIYRLLDTILYKCVLNGALVDNYVGGFTQTTYTIPALYTTNYVSCDDTYFYYALHNVANKTQLVSYNTLTSTSVTNDWIPYRTDTDTFYKIPSTPSVSVFTDNVKVRITGIQSTI